MNFLQKLFKNNGTNENEGAKYLKLAERQIQPLSGKPSPEAPLTQHFESFKVMCPLYAQRVSHTICQQCKFFGGFRMQRMIQFRSPHGYQYLTFPISDDLAKRGKWKTLPSVRIIYAPEAVVCNYPTYLTVDPEWREGFNHDPDEELKRMCAEVEK